MSNENDPRASNPDADPAYLPGSIIRGPSFSDPKRIVTGLVLGRHTDGHDEWWVDTIDRDEKPSNMVLLTQPIEVLRFAPDACGLSGVWMRPVRESQTPLEKIQHLLEKELVGLGPLPRAVKLEKIARGVAKLAAESGDAKGEAFWTARADQALHAAEDLAREAARDPKGAN